MCIGVAFEHFFCPQMKANQIAGITRDFKMDIIKINKSSYILINLDVYICLFFENRATEKCQCLALIVNLMALVT